ncbi:glutathione S-transferase family protein [Lysobacter sp. KIS68-7]|uniref:glutathione S-transferase family protein n=1 Tax=Lysobacter sp. KIS68-7 TaxID=2904252 RepID=UPI001E611C2F|nr:glutathione S-transferase family protein [Lysobacter sp. KIS68-7]UHQ19838.1 glutathione S-transferase family protein [Lysobacter sp. KIS68-7]
MLTLFDYLPSRNAWKVRQLLAHLGIPHATQQVSIFEGEGQSPGFLALNPTGRVPAIRLDDGRALAESNAILAFLADGTRYLPSEPYARAKVHQWLSFEQENVESTIGALRHWTMTGKLERRSAELVAAKRKAGLRALDILDTLLASHPFIAGDAYTIADIALFAYASRAEEAGIALTPYSRLREWVARIEAQPDFDGVVHPYSVDPHSVRELQS